MYVLLADILTCSFLWINRGGSKLVEANFPGKKGSLKLDEWVLCRLYNKNNWEKVKVEQTWLWRHGLDARQPRPLRVVYRPAAAVDPLSILWPMASAGGSFVVALVVCFLVGTNPRWHFCIVAMPQKLTVCIKQIMTSASFQTNQRVNR
ncbi:uncharacterized protein LOC119324952 [Triticum dicoccoides]|uniref:uncharacterized protein LOC119324952 n=1 Tax=Triticum dicoccoides TaxID=85692 RepID=UPI00188E73F8|nr:uncharacterized protein LOC119324952 [Triticum dicoccoides]